MKKNIYILIENAQRELDGRILLGLKLLKKNYNVVIGHKGSLLHIINKFNPGIVFFKSIGPLNTKIIKDLKYKNFKIVTCDEEMLATGKIEEMIDYRITKENFMNTDIIFAVGNYDGEAIKRKFNEEDKVKLVGNLRIDTLKKPINNIFNEEVSYLNNKYGNYFLLGTQFGRINAENKNNDFMIDSVFSLMSEGHKADSELVKSYKKMFNYQRENMEKTIEFLIEFSNKIPDKKLIIKPHPNEKSGFWKNLIEKQKISNIFVFEDKKINTNSLILASECVIACNSTILLESSFLNKKCINYIPLKKDENIEKEVLIKSSTTVRDIDTLIQNLKNIENIKNLDDKSNISNFIINYEENNFSSDKIVECLENLELRKYNSHITNLKYNIFLITLSLLAKIKKIIKKTYDFKPKTNQQVLLKKLHNRKIGNLMSPNNFKIKTKLIAKTTGINNFKTREIVPNVFNILEK